MDFIAAGLVEFFAGVASAAVLAAYAWWAPLLLGGAWLATHWLLRESGAWKDRNTEEVREAQRHAEYSYRLAVDPPAAKELRLFGLADWTIGRFMDEPTATLDAETEHALFERYAIELMARAGQYAELYGIQAAAYR